MSAPPLPAWWLFGLGAIAERAPEICRWMDDGGPDVPGADGFDQVWTLHCTRSSRGWTTELVPGHVPSE